MPFASFARGHISPTSRVKLAPREALVPATGSLPARCVDGRWPLEGSFDNSPCLPGAFLSPALALADAEAALSSGAASPAAFRPAGGPAPSADLRAAAERLAEIMRADGYRARIHTGPTPKGGCGAIDALPDILTMTREPGLDPAARALGLPEPAAIAPAGPASFLYDLVEAQALAGSHAESAVIINHLPNQTVDRTALACEVFWVDAWAIHTTADYLADRCGSDGERARAVLSAFATATLAMLCAGDMPVTVIDNADLDG